MKYLMSTVKDKRIGVCCMKNLEGRILSDIFKRLDSIKRVKQHIPHTIRSINA